MTLEIQSPLHILCFPVMGQGHLLPMIDMAKLFASRGVKATVLTTPANAPLVQPPIERANNTTGRSTFRYPIQLSFIPFPTGTGLPEGCENLSSVPPHLMPNFFGALGMLKEPFAETLRELRPDCVVTGMFFPWTYSVAAELGIPRVVFHGSNFFSRCARDSVMRHNVFDNLTSGARTMVLPGLPHKIEMLVSQVVDQRVAIPGIPHMVDLLEQMEESEEKSYSVVVNSFYELESDYADHFRTVMGRKVWHVGPMLLCNPADPRDNSSRGNTSKEDSGPILRWLDSKKLGSVIYVCFGSASDVTTDQLRQIALGLEASNHCFIWGARKVSNEAIPEGFEERVGERGFVIRGWAPQVMILDHVAVGAFLTHCGWNSILEGVCAGLPFVTWPLFADQFCNERLLVDVLKIGVAVGSTTNSIRADKRPLIESEAIGAAVKRLMEEGEAAEEMKRRAKEFGELAKIAVKEGGSSYVDTGKLIQELEEIRNGGVSSTTFSVS